MIHYFVWAREIPLGECWWFEYCIQNISKEKTPLCELQKFERLSSATLYMITESWTKNKEGFYVYKHPDEGIHDDDLDLLERIANGYRIMEKAQKRIQTAPCRND